MPQTSSSDEAPGRWVCGRLTYDGTDYYGFQYQVGVPTIQATLEMALARVARPLSRVIGAGRTDRGVHARGQVIAANVMWKHPIEKLQDAWNAQLPANLALRDVTRAPDGFHPRFSATQRRYRYSVVETRRRRQRLPLAQRYAWVVDRMLDLDTMNEAAALLVGEHDFATFGQPTQGESTKRQVQQALWDAVPVDGFSQAEQDTGRRLVLTISANGFLRNMVRCIVGSCVAVGRGDWDVAAMADALAAQDRSRTAPPAPPNGLVLEQVVYPVKKDPWTETNIVLR